MKWLDGKDYSYKTKTEESLTAFKETAIKENYFDGVKSDFELLQKTLNHDKKQDLIKNKKEIMQLLQGEIVTRYYYQRGRLQNQLKEDDEVIEAINVLSEQNKYEGILKGK
ncbi:MAG: hypothetical protein IT257_12795 [Chitinophagaceae bacterium]|nr:hypothetical protein [Chitinophagaceae bacterium]